MSSELWLGLGGLASTVISSALGLYYTSRARTASYRDRLHARQGEIIELILDRASELYLLLGELTGDHEDMIAHDRIYHKAVSSFDQLSALSSRAFSSLPTALLKTYGELNNMGTALLVDLARNHGPPEALADFVRALQRFANQSRDLLGVDPLSEESLRLFTSGRRSPRVEDNIQLRPPRPNA
jgi:hypothetical protein